MNVDSRASRFGYQLGLLGFTRFTNVLRLAPLAPAIEIRYLPLLLLLIVVSLISVPLRLLETLIWGRRIQQAKINEAPVFILGHWRSGTTYLHNLLIQDSTFGYVSMYQSIAPECSLIGGSWLQQFLARLVPLKRPMDNMCWPLDAPQEEEFALSKMLPWAFYVSLLFPGKNREFFAKAVEFKDYQDHRFQSFACAYRKVLAIATLRAGGKQLILKNPINTARIGVLLELFPKARFIHIARNPYEVFSSTLGLYQNLGTLTRLQALPPGQDRESIAAIYDSMMHRYFTDRDLIPEGQLVEVRFEDLERDPLRELGTIYQKLGLHGFESSLSSFQSYLETQSSYIKNNHKISDADRNFVNTRWQFAFQPLGYSPKPQK